jgi:CheY-like chemotaxis protein
MTGNPNQLVLIVEDDRDIRESLVELLEDAGIPSIAAENGAVAMDILKQGKILL